MKIGDLIIIDYENHYETEMGIILSSNSCRTCIFMFNINREAYYTTVHLEQNIKHNKYYELVET